MSNFLHKVNVVFHAQDHLSRRVDHIGKKFLLADKHVKAFERQQRVLEQTTNRLTKAQDAYAKAEVANEKKLTAARRASSRALHQLQEKRVAHAQNVRSRLAKIQDAEFAHINKLRTMREKAAADIDAIDAKFHERMEKRRKDYQKQQTGYRGRISDKEQQVTNLRAGGARTLGSHERIQLQQEIEYAQMRIEQEIARRDSNLRKLNPGSKDYDESVDNEFNRSQKAVQVIQKQMADNKKLLADEEKLRKLDNDIVDLQRQKYDHTKAHREEVRKLRNERNEHDREMIAHHQELERLERAGHAEEMDRLREEMRQKQENHDREMKRRRELLAMQRADTVATRRSIQEEIDARKTNLDVMEATREEEKRRLQQIDADNDRHRRNNIGLGATSVGAAGMAVGGFGLAGLAYGGHHAVEKAIELDTEKRALAQATRAYNMRGGKHDRAATGQTWAEFFFDLVGNSNQLVGNTKFRTTSLEQTHLINEMVSADIKPHHVQDMMAPMLGLKRVFGLRGIKSDNMEQELATIMERSGAIDGPTTVLFADAITRALNVSKRSTPKNLQDVLLKASGSMHNIGLNEEAFAKSFGDFDYLFATDPSGARVATQIANFNEAMLRGGTNRAANDALVRWSKYGMWDLSEDRVKLLDDNGEPVQDEYGRQKWIVQPVPVFKDRSSFGAIMKAVQRAARLDAGISDELWASDTPLTAQQQTAYSKALQTVVHATRGGRMLSQTSTRKEQHKWEESNMKFERSAGLWTTLAESEGSYPAATQNLGNAWTELMTLLGKELQEPMTRLVEEVTGLVLSITEWVKANPGLVASIFDIIKGITIFAMVIGTAVLAAGAFILAVGNWPVILGGIAVAVGVVLWGLVSKVTDVFVELGVQVLGALGGLATRAWNVITGQGHKNPLPPGTWHAPLLPPGQGGNASPGTPSGGGGSHRQAHTDGMTPQMAHGGMRHDFNFNVTSDGKATSQQVAAIMPSLAGEARRTIRGMGGVASPGTVPVV